MKITKGRTYLEVSVGNYHLLDVIFHIRRCDINWFNNKSNQPDAIPNNEQDVENDDNRSPTTTPFEELLEILRDTIIPRFFAEEIEIDTARTDGYYHKLPPKHLGPGGIPIDIKTSSTTTTNANNPPKPTKRKRKAAVDNTKEDDKLAAKKQNEATIYYAFGEIIQFMYKVETPQTTPHYTLVFENNSYPTTTTTTTSANQNQSHHNPEFRELKKLSKRIVLWCCQRNENDEFPDDCGFYRSELVPVSSLFVQLQQNQSTT